MSGGPRALPLTTHARRAHRHTMSWLLHCSRIPKIDAAHLLQREHVQIDPPIAQTSHLLLPLLIAIVQFRRQPLLTSPRPPWGKTTLVGKVPTLECKRCATSM